MKIVNMKGAAIAAVSLAALLAVSACSGGGAAPTNASSGGGGGGGNSGYTFAMVTHESPGDTFWDRIRAGAEQAAKDTGSTLKYSADPVATNQAVLIQKRGDGRQNLTQPVHSVNTVLVRRTRASGWWMVPNTSQLDLHACALELLADYVRAS